MPSRASAPRKSGSTKQFGKDWKRLQELQHVMQLLIRGRAPLPPQYADHPLRGQWADCRDCHVRGEWLLVYRSGDLRRAELRRPLVHVAVAGGEDDEVGGERRAIRQHDGALAELRDAAVLELDAAVDDHLGCADLDVVARAAAQVDRVQAGAVL